MVRFRLWLGVVIAVAMLSLNGTAQQSGTEAPTKAEVVRFLDLMGARSQMVRVLEGMEKQMRAGAQEGFKAKVPNATPEQLAKVDKLFAGIFDDLPVDEMMDAIVPIYQRHLTRADLAAVTAFYSSASGQKILKEMPAITNEAMAAGGDIGRRVFESRSAEFDQKMANLIEGLKKDNGPADK